ncbi:MAG: class I SAM-dependent methyltransferase, partial [Bacteroidetes bacterium]|nr:class I SAM-dependent methyltransferase [Bacteroidota bacterium]
MIFNSIKKTWNRKFNKINWYNLRTIKPVSKVFGLDRGIPIDRYYIEKFLGANKKYITGKVLEIAESTYSKRFDNGVKSFEVLHVNNSIKGVTIIGDLTKKESLPDNQIDCFICTQTLNFIYNFHDAIKGIHHLLKPGGVALITLAGISQISRYDMERWGDYWRFTDLSAKKIFSEVFGEENVIVDFYGNVLST